MIFAALKKHLITIFENFVFINTKFRCLKDLILKKVRQRKNKLKRGNQKRSAKVEKSNRNKEKTEKAYQDQGIRDRKKKN